MPIKGDADRQRAIFSKNLNYYMERTGKNTADLSSDLSFPFSTVSDWVHGKKYPRMDKVQTIADYFGILKSNLTEEDLCQSQSEGKNPPSTDESALGEELRQEISRLMSNLSDEQRDLFLAILRLTDARNRGLPVADLVLAGEAALKSGRHSRT